MREIQLNLDLDEVYFQPLVLKQGDPIKLEIHLYKQKEPYIVKADTIEVVVGDYVHKVLKRQSNHINIQDHRIQVILPSDFLPNSEVSGLELVMNEQGNRYTTFVIPLRIETSLSRIEE